MNTRIRHFIEQFQVTGCDAYLVTKDVNISYLTQFPASESWLLISPKKVFYITDFRYVLEARQGLKGIRVVPYTKSMFTTLFTLLRGLKAKTIGFDERHMSLAFHRQLLKETPGLKWLARPGLIEQGRAIKQKEEVRQIRACLKLHLQAYDYLKGVVRPGLTEQDVLRRLENYVKDRHAGFSFSPIIASGPNSCFPHARVSDRRIKNNEPVLIDMGIELNGYKSDLTRMFFLGKISPLVRQVNECVAQAQRLAMAGIKAGVRAADIDALARNHLQKKGLAKYFGHSLGHGVGLEIHEDPRLSQSNKTVLKAGMVVTVEPAVYIPHKFGIRIEDMVLVTERGGEVLSR